MLGILLRILYISVGIIGVYLFIKVHSSKPPRLIAGVIHGSLGLLGLALFIIYISFLRGETPVTSFLLLLTAFFFGGGMLATTLSRKRYPKAILYIHVLFAIAGIYFLFRFFL